MNPFKSFTYIVYIALIGFFFFSNTIRADETIIEEEECKEVTTVENFDIDIYASAPWYVHQQAENAYSPIEQNYCVTAQYTVRESPTFPWGYTVDVFNQAQYESGVTVEGNLCAYQTDDSPSKLAVAPCFLPKWAAGPYWVVAYDELEGYALISGGQPDEVSENGCTTGTGINNSGLWIFSRSQERNETLVDKVRSIAVEAGFDVSVLNDVNQTVCDDCKDEEGTFTVGFFGEKDCEWVGNRWWGCLFYGGSCPDTCGLC